MSILTKSNPTSHDRGWWLYLILHWSGVLVSTLLMSWGLFVLVFLAIGDFSLDGAMLHIDNFASRYVTADAARVSHFKSMLLVVQCLAICSLLVLRRGNLAPRDPKPRVGTHG